MVKERVFKDRFANSMNENQFLRGILPKNLFAYNIYKTSEDLSLAVFIVSVLFFGLMFVDFFDFLTKLYFYPFISIGLFILSAFVFLVGYLFRLLFLRKPYYDDWVYEIAKSILGTEVIFYDSKYLYIQYDRKIKDIDKREFVTQMTDKSDHYSYFYIKTFIDAGVIVVKVVKRQPIPTIAVLNPPEDDKIWNAVPLGIGVNESTLKIAPLVWYLNDENKNELAIPTIPSTSFVCAGGTGSGKSVMENGIVGHVSRYSDHFQLVGVDCKQVS